MMSRAAIFGAILGLSSKEYDGGHVMEGESFAAPDGFADYIAMMETHYLDTANLTFIAPDGQTLHIQGLTGVQQGDPALAAMFASVGQHLTLAARGKVSQRYQSVYIVVQVKQPGRSFGCQTERRGIPCGRLGSVEHRQSGIGISVEVHSKVSGTFQDFGSQGRREHCQAGVAPTMNRIHQRRAVIRHVTVLGHG
eukprot:14296-Rhodomonas_salina.1